MKILFIRPKNGSFIHLVLGVFLRRVLVLSRMSAVRFLQVNVEVQAVRFVRIESVIQSKAKKEEEKKRRNHNLTHSNFI